MVDFPYYSKFKSNWSQTKQIIPSKWHNKKVVFKDASVPDWKDFHGFFPLAPLQFQPKTNKYKSKNTNQLLVELGLEVFLFWLMTVMKNDFSERNFWESIWDCSSIKPRARITLNSLPRLYHNFLWKLVSLINNSALDVSNPLIPSPVTEFFASLIAV